ncbi:unnamed protein product, partial [Laminaria digitata]
GSGRGRYPSRRTVEDGENNARARGGGGGRCGAKGGGSGTAKTTSPWKRMREARARGTSGRVRSPSTSQPKRKKMRRDTRSGRTPPERDDQGRRRRGGGDEEEEEDCLMLSVAASDGATARVNAPSGLEIAAHVEGVGVWNEEESDSSDDDIGSRKRRPKAFGVRPRSKRLRGP